VLGGSCCREGRAGACRAAVGVDSSAALVFFRCAGSGSMRNICAQARGRACLHAECMQRRPWAVRVHVRAQDAYDV